MAMLDDESVPTFFANANFSSSSSIDSLSDCELNYSNKIKMKRRKSLSLYNISSTPCGKFKTCYPNTRCKSHYDVEKICKPKRNKYAHVQSKIRKYIIETNKEQDESKERRLLAEQKIREELPNIVQLESKIMENARMFESLEHQKILEELPKFEPNLIQLEGDLLRNFAPFQEDPIVDQLEQKSEQHTPDFLHESKPINCQSLIKTCLFKQSPAIRSRSIVNTPRLSIFEGNSTCRTIDVQDLRSNESIAENKDDFVFKNSKYEPFYVKSISPISNISSNAPLLDFQMSGTTEEKRGVRKFIDRFLKCPKFLKRKRCSRGAMFKSKIYPDYKIPQVVIVSPNAMDLDSADSGNQSDVPSSKNKNRESRITTNKNNLNNIQLTQNQEFQLEEIVQCADELTYRINVFKTLTQDFLTTNRD